MNPNATIIKYAKHFAGISGIPCGVLDIPAKQPVYDLEFCRTCPTGCSYCNTHSYGCYEAQRWGGKYIYYCPGGFIFIAAVTENEMGLPESGVLAGPIAMGAAEDFGDTHGAPILDTVRVNDAAELMGAVFAAKSPSSEDSDNSEFLNDVYKVVAEIRLKNTDDYPVTLEHDLQEAIMLGDTARSRELLNRLLGYIFFCSNADLHTIKSRVLELLVLLSRSAIAGGADIKQIFALNSNYIKQLSGFQNLERLSVWLTGVLNRYIGYVFDFSDAKHADVMHKVTAYVKTHYHEKITLADLSQQVYLSQPYLSKIFKEEMQCSFTAYVNSVRIEQSKHLLVDTSLSLVEVANAIGFDDQSYFTKVFKNTVGISPGRYREKRGITADEKKENKKWKS